MANGDGTQIAQATSAQPPPQVPDHLSDLRISPLDTDELQQHTLTQACAALPQPQTPEERAASFANWTEQQQEQWAKDHPILPPNSRLEQAYAHLKSIVSKHEGQVSEKYLAPFRRSLDLMASDLQQAAETGHTKTQGQLTYPTRLLAGGVGALLKAVPVGRDIQSTLQANIVPPEFGPEGRALSKELGAAQSEFRIAAKPSRHAEFHNEFHEAVHNTEGAELSDKGLTLDVVRHQKPEQAGERAIRTGVFFLPEKKSPYQRYYTTGRIGYGGTQRIEGRTTFQNPIIAKGASGGKVPERAYDALNGEGAYDAMRQDVLDATVHGWGPRNDAEAVNRVRDVLEKYGGNPDLAEDIVHNSKGGNTLPYAVQEHIVASSVRKAGHDAIIGYSKIKGQHRLSEVFDLRRDKYPISSELFEPLSGETAQPKATSGFPVPKVTVESKARERAANLKHLGIGLTEMNPEDARNWVGYTNQKSLKVYRGVDNASHTIQPGDYVTTSKEAAQNYGKHVQEMEVSPEELRYVRGHKDGDPKLLDIAGRQNSSTRLKRKPQRPE